MMTHLSTVPAPIQFGHNEHTPRVRMEQEIQGEKINDIEVFSLSSHRTTQKKDSFYNQTKKNPNLIEYIYIEP